MPYYSVSPHPRKNRSGATETNEAWPPTSQSFFIRAKRVMPLLGPLLPPATLFYGTFRNAIRAEMFPPLSKCLAGSQGVQKPVGCAASCPLPSPAAGRRDFCPLPQPPTFQSRGDRVMGRRSQCKKATSPPKEKLGVKHLRVWEASTCFVRAQCCR